MIEKQRRRDKERGLNISKRKRKAVGTKREKDRTKGDMNKEGEIFKM